MLHEMYPGIYLYQDLTPDCPRVGRGVYILIKRRHQTVWIEPEVITELEVLADKLDATCISDPILGIEIPKCTRWWHWSLPSTEEDLFDPEAPLIDDADIVGKP